MEQKNPTYYAFISYSHKDHAIAKKLQNRLQRYHLPSKLQQNNPELPKNLRPIFIDESNLVGTALQDALNKNLRTSKYLIVICSPNSAKSEYVNNEVKYFIENGKSKKIIPLIIDGTPHSDDPETECFPPALLALPKENELLGIDLKKFKTRGAFLRVIATLLELEIRDFISYEDELRKKRIMIFTPIAAALVFIAGFLVWRNIPHVYYYRTYVYRWEKPIGLFEVDSEADRKKMSYTYKFTTLRDEVQKIERVNSAGVLVEPDFVTPMLEPPMLVFLPDRSVEYFDQYKHKIYRKVYSKSMKIVEFFCGDGDIHYALPSDTASNYKGDMMYNPEFSAMQETGNIICVTLDFDDNGYVRKKMFRRDKVGGRDKYGSLTRDGKGRWGLGYEVDEFGRITAIHNLDMNGETMPIRGCRSITFEYGNSPNPVRSSNLDKNGALVLNEDGVAFEIVSYDENFNVASWSVYDTEGNPTLSTQNHIHRAITSHDENGFTISESYYDTNLEPCLNKDGYFRAEVANDANGSPVKISYYNVKDEKTICSDGYAEMLQEFNENGNILHASFFDVNGNPTVDSNHAYAKRGAYDNNGLVCKIDYLDQNGNLMLNKYGYASFLLTYDYEENKVAGFTYTDTNGNLTLTSDGYAEQRFTYIDGNKDTITYYDINGNLTPDRRGVARYVFKYENGNHISTQYFGIDGKPTIASNGYAKFDREYDDNGLRICERYYDADGKRTFTTDGYSAIKYTYDSRGNTSSESYYDTEDKPVIVRNENFSISKKFEHDDFGNITHTQYIRPENPEYQDMLDSLVKDEFREYDLHGNMTKIYRLNARGEEISFNGTADDVRRENEYDVYGRNIRALFYRRGETQPSTIQEQEYDSFGRMISLHGVKYTGDQKQEVTEKTEYDQFGNKTKIYYLDGENKLVGFMTINGSGRERYAIFKAKYDIFGNETEIWYYDENEQPIHPQDRGFHNVSTFDSKGRILSYSRYNSEDESEPIEINEIHRNVSEYDALGHETDRWFYGIDGNLIHSSKRGCHLVRTYDKFGRITSAATYDADGNLTTEDGVSKVMRAYDPRGNQTDEWYFDANGKPCVRFYNGIPCEHHSRASYDPMGNILTFANFDINDEPDTSRNYYKRTNTYDVYGLLTETAYYTFLAGEDVLLGSTRYSYNSEGRKIKEEYYNSDGEKFHEENF